MIEKYFTGASTREEKEVRKKNQPCLAVLSRRVEKGEDTEIFIIIAARIVNRKLRSRVVILTRGLVL